LPSINCADNKARGRHQGYLSTAKNYQKEANAEKCVVADCTEDRNVDMQKRIFSLQ